MAKKEKFHNFKITLPLIALCLPLFANQYVTAENGCPFETFIRVEGKCLDISAKGIDNIAEQLDIESVEEINREIEDLSEEIKELCVIENPEHTAQINIVEDMCQD